MSPPSLFFANVPESSMTGQGQGRYVELKCCLRRGEYNWRNTRCPKLRTMSLLLCLLMLLNNEEITAIHCYNDNLLFKWHKFTTSSLSTGPTEIILEISVSSENLTTLTLVYHPLNFNTSNTGSDTLKPTYTRI